MKPRRALFRSSLTDFAMCWAPSTPGAFSGIDGSNPVPSSGESANSRSQHVAEGTSSNAHPIVLGGVIRQQMAEVPFPQEMGDHITDLAD